MIRIPIPGDEPRRSIVTTAFGRRFVLTFAWSSRAAAWTVAPYDAKGALLAPERIAGHGVVVINARAVDGSLVGRIAMVDLDPAAGVLRLADLGTRLVALGYTAAELASVVPSFQFSAVATVSE